MSDFAVVRRRRLISTSLAASQASLMRWALLCDLAEGHGALDRTLQQSPACAW